MDSGYNLYLTILLLVVIIVLGTAGYTLIEGWSTLDSFFMTLITLTTIGYGEVKPLSEFGKIFTVGLIVSGVFTVGIGISYATKVILEGELTTFYGKKRMLKKIKHLKNHYIVCGYGRIGSLVCTYFKKAKVPMVVITREERDYELASQNGFLAILGDATMDNVLNIAGIERAKGIICSVSSDSQNVFITLSSKSMNPDIKVYARAFEESTIKKLQMAGADKVIAPNYIGGVTLAQAVLKPHVAEFIEFASMSEEYDFSIDDVVISPNSPFCDVNVIDSKIRQNYDLIIAAIKKKNDEFIFNPHPQSMIEAHDRLIVLGQPDKVSEFREAATGAAERK